MQSRITHLTTGFTAIAAAILIITTGNLEATTTGMMGGHSFNMGAEADFTGKSCLVCHEPNDNGSPSEFKLRDVSDSNSTLYTMYTTSSGNRGTLSNATKLCLSCHDGTIASDASSGMGGGFASSMSIGTDLRNDHPVGVAYPPRTRRRASATKYFATPQGNIRVYGDSIKTVECISCHDPHGGPIKKMLREPMRGSALCLKCHNL